MLPLIVAPSLLSCDFAALAAESREIIAQGADWLHVDVMDGHFVDNLTLGPPIVKCLHAAVPDAFLDVHLMVSEPEKWLAPMAAAGANVFTFHLEAVADAAAALELVRKVHAAGMQAGLALRPNTSTNAVTDALLAELDLFLVMTIEPGFGGQSFRPELVDKCAEIRARRSDINIQVDGGIKPSTVGVASRAGANVFVAGTAIFGAPDRAAAIAELKSCALADA